MKDSKNLECSESSQKGTGIRELWSDLMSDALNCFAVVQDPCKAVGWDILAGICDPDTNCYLLNTYCKLES